jgi:hypothetical protein
MSRWWRQRRRLGHGGMAWRRGQVDPSTVDRPLHEPKRLAQPSASSNTVVRLTPSYGASYKIS